MGGARRRRDAALVFEYDKSLSCGLATGGYIAVRSAAPRMVRPSHPPRTGVALHMASRRVVHRLRRPVTRRSRAGFGCRVRSAPARLLVGCGRRLRLLSAKVGGRERPARRRRGRRRRQSTFTSAPPRPTATIGRDMTGVSQAPSLVLTAPAATAPRTAVAVRTAPAQRGRRGSHP
jgi:hypothetical protein